MKILLHVLFMSILLGPIAAQETDSLRERSNYRKAWDTAMADDEISRDERALLNIMVESMLLPLDSTRFWEARWTPKLGKPLDQSGRWPLVLQNIAIGSGLYGWGIPYVLHAEDGRWYVGGVMVSAGGVFYLTYKYTKDMEMSHARTQMMRYGSLLGLRYGTGMNLLLDLDDGLDEYENDGSNENTDPETLWMWMLMASVPAGHYGGELLFEKYEPTNGQAWAWTMWTGVAGITSRLIYNVVREAPEGDEFGFGNDESYRKELDKWEKGKTLVELLAYPLGAYGGYQITKDKQYTFGDALMLVQGWGFGWINTMMLQSIFFDGGNEEAFFLVSGLGAIGSSFAYDHYIQQEDFTFGQSTLMLLGSASGTAFGFGTGILLDVRNKEAFLAMALAGYGTGTWLTRRILDVKADGALVENTSTRVLLSPTVLPTIGYNEKASLVPGFNLHISFR